MIVAEWPTCNVGSVLEIELTRGEVVESTHRVQACAADVSGVVVGEASPGDAEWRTFLRSSAKPFQAAPAAAAGVIERLGLDDRHLAVACASHDGSAAPTALVREILAAAGLDDSAVMTGDDGQGGLVEHQCSGNHALVLAFCVVEGWPTATYLELDHPAQRAMQSAVAAAVGGDPEVMVDNCGMPTHRVTLREMATGFARLGVGWSGLAGLDRVAAAMRSHPAVVRGLGEIDTDLMVADRRLVAKVGAEAALGIGSSDGVGIGLRIVDGGTRAWGPAGVACAVRWIGLDPASSVAGLLGEPPALDARGEPVGRYRAVWRDR